MGTGSGATALSFAGHSQALDLILKAPREVRGAFGQKSATN